MEIFILLLIVAVGLFWYFNRTTKSFDVNQDGKVDLADVKTATINVAEGVKAEVKAVEAEVAVVVEKAKKTVAKKTAKKPAVKKPRTPKAKKTAQ